VAISVGVEAVYVGAVVTAESGFDDAGQWDGCAVVELPSDESGYEEERGDDAGEEVVRAFVFAAGDESDEEWHGSDEAHVRALPEEGEYEERQPEEESGTRAEETRKREDEEGDEEGAPCGLKPGAPLAIELGVENDERKTEEEEKQGCVRDGCL